MDAHGWIAVAVLCAATALFVTKRLPIGVTALLIPVVLFVTRVLETPDQALSGFASRAALAIAAIMVIGAGLRECGVATLMARGLERVAGKSEAGLVLSVMVATAALSAVMSNAAVVAMLLPVGLALSRRCGVRPSRLMLPMAYAAMLGGTVTLIGTAPNFLVDGYLRQLPDAEQFRVFDFAGTGLAITGVGILFMVLIGRRMLPEIHDNERLRRAQLPEDVAKRFELEHQLFMFRVAEQSPVVGRTITETDIRARFGISLVMVRRGRGALEKWLQPDPGLALQAEDRLYGEGSDAAAWDLAESELLQLGFAGPTAVDKILGHGTTMAEVTLPPRSSAIGRTFKDLEFRQRFGLNVLMLWRYGAPVGGDERARRLSVGDTFMVTGLPERVRKLSKNPDYIVLSDNTQAEDVTRAPLALLLLLLAVVPPIVSMQIPLPLSALAAAVLMVATGCLSRPGLARSVDWNVICLIVGTLPLGIALEQHGVAGVAATAVTDFGGAMGTPGVIGLLFLLAAVLATLTSNAAAAVIMAPVAAGVAGPAGLTVASTLLAVAYGASCAFLLPFSQCNILVFAAGGYRTKDFVKVGACVSLLMGIVTVAVLSL